MPDQIRELYCLEAKRLCMERQLAMLIQDDLGEGQLWDDTLAPNRGRTSLDEEYW